MALKEHLHLNIKIDELIKYPIHSALKLYGIYNFYNSYGQELYRILNQQKQVPDQLEQDTSEKQTNTIDIGRQQQSRRSWALKNQFHPKHNTLITSKKTQNEQSNIDDAILFASLKTTACRTANQ